MNSTKNLDFNNKEKENFSTLNNVNNIENNHTQRISLLSNAGHDITINHVSLLEHKNTMSSNVFHTMNAFSHQNSINNISTSSDSNHIKVIVRFRPMNNVENVINSYFKFFSNFK